MKGISAVIAVVLILMITVALAAMAYVWFTDVFGTITEGAGEAAEGAGDIIATSFSIDSARYLSEMIDVGGSSDVESNVTVYLANSGSADIDLDTINVYVDGLLAGEANGFDGTLTPGETVSLKLNKSGDYDGTWCDETLEIKYGSLSQTTTIVC